MIPILAIPGLELSAVTGSIGRAIAGVPVEHVAVVAFVALLAAAWLDAGSSGPPREAGQWK